MHNNNSNNNNENIVKNCCNAFSVSPSVQRPIVNYSNNDDSSNNSNSNFNFNFNNSNNSNDLISFHSNSSNNLNNLQPNNLNNYNKINCSYNSNNYSDINKNDHNNSTTLLSAIRPPRSDSHQREGPLVPEPVERREIFVLGFTAITDTVNLSSLSFAVLKAILPSLNREDICSCRCIPRSASETRHPSFIVRLVSSDLVNRIMRAKRSINYFSTMDIDRSLLCPEAAAALSHSKILVNEVLPSADYQRYQVVKEAAKKMGFKYVWHSAGDVLVRRGVRDRVHAVRSVSDLSALLATSVGGAATVERSADFLQRDSPPAVPQSSGRGNGTV